MHFESVPAVDEEENTRIRDGKVLQLESVRPASTKTPPFRSRNNSQTAPSVKTTMGTAAAPYRRRSVQSKQEPDNAVQAFLVKYSWYLQLGLANIVYLWSLEACNERDKHCERELGNKSKYWVFKLAFVAWLMASAMLSSFHELVKGWLAEGVKTVTKIKTFFLCFNYFFLCSLNQGLSWQAHGTLNRIIFTNFLIIFVLARAVNAFARSFKNSSWFVMRYAILTFFYGAIIIWMKHHLIDTSKDYSLGFAGDKVANQGKLCSFHKFSVNYYSAFDDLFWGLAHTNSDCKERRGESAWWRPSTKEDKPKYVGQYLAYPLTTRLNSTTKQHYTMLQEYVVANMRPITKAEASTAPEEVFLDITTPTPSVVIDVKRNESIIKQAIELRNVEKELKRPNVLFLLVDSVSRQHFFRKMKKTAVFIEENYFKNKEKLTGYQFFRYHSVSKHSENNLLALRYDDAKGLGEGMERVRIERYFRDQGWITSEASGKCGTSEYQLDAFDRDRAYTDKSSAHHEFYSLACDPNAFPKKDPFGMFRGPFSEFRRCLYGTDASAHVLQYSLDFWRKYKDQPKFQSLTLMDGHEFTGELPQYLDDHLESYLRTLTSEGLLEDSIVFLLSDNGNTNNFLFSSTESGKNEAVNPFLSVFLSANNVERFGRHISANQQRLLSPHDIFRVLGELSHTFKEYKGLNFFTEEIPEDRRCNDETVEVDLELCRCK